MIFSPFNYMGGKRRILPLILGKVVDNWNIGDYDTVCDLFCGGGTVGINIPSKTLHMNDLEGHMTSFFEYLKTVDIEEMLLCIDDIIRNYNPYTKEGYYRLRNDYNENQTPLVFFVLTCHSFNYLINFNQKGEFNVPNGLRTYCNSIKDRLISFTREIQKRDPIITNKDFRDIDLSDYGSNDFVYADPPYLISDAKYNRFWSEKEEHDLYDILKELDKQGCKFALSNVFENKGLENKTLKEFSKKYNVLYPNIGYNNCVYHRNDKTSKTVEVLITNF